MELPGPLWIAAIAVGAVVLIGLLALVLFKLIRRGKGRRDKSGAQNQARVEVLETTIIDEERKLVLVRCDKIEHLIMIGGPADLVVENDVKKVRPPAQTTKAASPLPSPAAATAQAAAANPLRVPPATAATLEAAIAAAVPKPAEPRPAARPAAELRQPAQQPPRATVVPAPPLPARAPVREPTREAPRDAEAPPAAQAAAARIAEAPRAPAPRPPSVDFGRRDTVAPRRPPQVQPASSSAQAPRPADARAQSNGAAGPGRPSGSGRNAARGSEEVAALPTAQVPWPDSDPIEGEIVQALRSEPQRRPEPPLRREPPTAKSIVDSSATLGDLADRLEEALAREMQSIGPGTGGGATPQQRADPDAAAFAFDNRSAPEEPAPERPKRPVSSRERPERRPEPAKQAAAPAHEPEQRREPQQQERREEAPVISLNARRREAADPLEDEMARLLGELTGDSKSGR